jgi:hypothetical protein
LNAADHLFAAKKIRDVTERVLFVTGSVASPVRPLSDESSSLPGPLRACPALLSETHRLANSERAFA